MDTMEGDFLTLDESDLVDITAEALDDNGGETINLVQSLKSDGVLPDVYTIGADGKLVCVSQLQDFKKHHVTETVQMETRAEEQGGTYIVGENGELVLVNNLTDFKKHHQHGVDHFRQEAFKRGAAHINVPQELMPFHHNQVTVVEAPPQDPPPMENPVYAVPQPVSPTKITIKEVPSSPQVPVSLLSPNTNKVHVFAVPRYQKKDVKIAPKPTPKATRPVQPTLPSPKVSNSGVDLQGLPVSSPITYINGVPGQIVSGRQLQELSTVLGFQPQIVTDSVSIISDVKTDSNQSRQMIMPASAVAPILRKPLPSQPLDGSPRTNSSKKHPPNQQDVSQTVIAKNSATYQREKNYYFSQTSVLSPLVPPHLTKKFPEEATNEALHLNDMVPLMTKVSDEWSMQGCITFGTGTEGQVFAPRLLVPRGDTSFSGMSVGDENSKVVTCDPTPPAPVSEELMQYQGMYTVNGLDIFEDMLVKRENPPVDTIGVENVYSTFEVLGVRQDKRADGSQENDLIEEEVEDERDDMEVEFDLGGQASGERITLNLRKVDESGSENIDVWTIKKEDDNEFYVNQSSSSSGATLTIQNGAGNEANTNNQAGTSSSMSAIPVQIVKEDPVKPRVDPFDKFSGFACYLCLYASKSREHVLQHWLDCHKTAKPYLCPYCKQEFGVSCNVFSHILLHHKGREQKSFKLAWSPIFKQNIEFILKGNGVASRVEITDEKAEERSPFCDFLYKCLGCDYRSVEISGIRKHLRETHYKILPYMCPYCSERFSTCFEAKRHVCLHHEPWAIKVFVSKSSQKSIDESVLNQRFTVTPLDLVEMTESDKELLGTNLWNESQDGSSLVYTCRTCGSLENNRSNIYSHVIDSHNALHGIVCPKCNYYNKLSRKCLVKGWATCTNCTFFLNLGKEDPAGKKTHCVPFYVCLECNHLERTKVSMVQHLKYMHLKCRPFKCAYCAYCHIEKAKVRIHILLKHKHQPVHILKNKDMDVRALETLQGMYKQVHLPQSAVNRLGKRKSDQSIDDDVVLDETLSSTIKRSHVISISDFKQKRIKEEEAEGLESPTKERCRPDRYSCKLCEHRSRDRYAMNRHVKSFHLNGKPYSCTVCRYGASFRYLVERHMRMCHPNSEKYVNTNYKMLSLLDEACKQYIIYLGESKKVMEKHAPASDSKLDLPASIGSIHLNAINQGVDFDEPPVSGDSDEEEEEDLEQMMVMEEEDIDQKPFAGASEYQGSSKPYLPIGDLKQRIMELNPEFQLDQKLVNEPVVVVDDVMAAILNLKKELE